MSKYSGRAVFLGGVAVSTLMIWDVPARSQTALPEIVVTAPSPIVRRAPARPRGPVTAAPAAPAAPAEPVVPQPSAALPPGWLPIVVDQFATVTVVTNDELRRSPGGTLGDLLFSKPGITGSSFAPGAASRPIVRGLDSYRVRVQENGIGSSGVSELAEDHGVPLDPLATDQIEVVRGPATLRWGSQAIGGVVNASNNRIPDALPCRETSAPIRTLYTKAAVPYLNQGPCVSFETRSAATTVDNGLEGAALLDAGAGNFAIHADAFARRGDDYRIPRYPYLFPPDPAPAVNGRQPNSSHRSDGQSIGGSYIFDNGFFGVAVSRFASLYRIPGIEATETNTRIDMNQIKVTSKGELRPQDSAIEAIRLWAGATDYKHNELANENGFDGVQQTFTNKEQEARVELQLLPMNVRFATLTTALGVQASHQELTAPGVEGGLFDPNQTRSIAGFLFNEFKFSDTLKMQVSGRIEQAHVNGSAPDILVDPLIAISRERNFTPKSAAVGFLQELPWDLVGSVTAQYVQRAPRAPELFSRGVHEATGTFDVGNPDLKIEVAQTVEVGLRRAKGDFRFEATAYYTKFLDFIFRRLTGETCDGDFASCSPLGAGGELNQAFYSQRDATFQGGEFQAQLDVLPIMNGMFGVEGQFDIVRATFSDGTNVPRIPPMRAGAGLFWRDGNWLARVNLLHAFPQKDIAVVGETPTAGYNLLKAEVSYTAKLMPTDLGVRSVTVGVMGNNLLNDDIRNHVSFKKDEVLLPGVNVRAFANLKF